jgi:hypothetical protein
VLCDWSRGKVGGAGSPAILLLIQQAFQNIDPSILKMERPHSFKTSANLYQAAWRRVPEEGVVEATLIQSLVS